ncbi:MAG TPA: 50S ribosomal protein L11 methyltransferase [Solirubrobacteraceae bacterium]|nr:50S ribosomal protein L11 methyltransferase [Solirubrobacteraceae bacterium]
MIRLALRVARADADLVLADLLELAPAGVEEIELPAADGGEPQVEYAVYGPPGELPELPDLEALAGGVQVQLSSNEVPDDWAERWKRFHRPVLVESLSVLVPSLHVRPPWEAAVGRDGVCEIVIDPAQAFGTGAHATTRLCLELMLALADEDATRGAVVDVGTGSGVLAIAAAKLGYRPVLALDNDPLSVEAAMFNASVAGVVMKVRRHDLRSPTPSAPVVLANLLRPLLLDLLERIESPPAHVIASGLLREEADQIAGAYAARFSLRERERRERGEWAALWLERPR